MRAAPLIVAAIVYALGSQAAVGCSGCGCRGGPGYRGPNGHCVGWAKLNKICGNPPSTRCAFEGEGGDGEPNAPAPDQEPGLNEHGMVPDQKQPAPPPIISNIQKAKADGLGCVDQATIRSVSSCSEARPSKDCAHERSGLISAKTCFEIPSGSTAAIEAGSYSFDWLRVRVPGSAQSLWTSRTLFLTD
jgi:hypothetical protein